MNSARTIAVVGVAIAMASVFALDAGAKDEGPTSAVTAGRTLWIASGDGYVSRLATTTGQQLGRRIRVGYYPAAIIASKDAIWVANVGSGGDAYEPRNGSISKIELSSGRLTATVRLPRASPRALATTSSSLWVVSTNDRRIFRVDLRSGRLVQKIRVRGHLVPWAIAATENRIWVSMTMSPSACAHSPACRLGKVRGAVLGIYTSSSRASTTRLLVGSGPNQLLLFRNLLWVSNPADGTVTVIRADTAKIVRQAIDVGSQPLHLAADRAWVFAATGSAHRAGLVRIDDSTPFRVRTLGRWSGDPVADVTASSGTVWVIDTKGRVVRCDETTGRNRLLVP
jgi:DNA-binding beta-propeller fold protein YncE